ncbi:MAG: S26 family signal peptidase [Acidimicrobiales bacterium]|nr:MAG: S26 family signal peptidase [Acidimicrobiales bacterium]
MFRRVLIGGAATVLVAMTASEIIHPPSPKLLYNPSESAPIGFYKIRKNSNYQRGDFVAAYAPDWARELAETRGYLPKDYPLIKMIWAVEGDQVCADNRQVSGPNGSDIARLLQDRLGRDMPTFDGCITLGKGEYFLVSIDEEYGKTYGFDSRYFGVVKDEQILGHVQYLGEDMFGSADNNTEKLAEGEK